MTEPLQVAQALYRALQNWDESQLSRLLADDVVGDVTEGLPGSLGGRHVGREAMLRQVWGRVAAMFEKVRPEPDEFLEVAGDRILVLGRYHATARDSGRQLDAAFAHLITVEDGRITALRQFTDSQRWAEALAAGRGADRRNGSAEGAQVVRRALEAAEARDLGALLREYAPDIELQEAPSLPYGGAYVGKEAVVDHATGFLATWDPLQTPQDRQLDFRICDGESLVAAVWRTKVSRGPKPGFTMPAVSLFQVEDGRVRNLRMFHFDTAGIRDYLASVDPA